MSSIIILIGASVRAMAFSALRAGYQPYAIDLFADRDLAAICPAVRVERYPAGFLPALAAAPDAPWMYTGGLENYPRLIERLAAIRPLLGNGAAVLGRARNLGGFADAVQAAGLAFPPILGAGGRATALLTNLSGQWLVKPRRGSGGFQIRPAAAADCVRPPRGTYLQQYVEGQAASAVYIAAGGKAELLGASRQLSARDFGLERPFAYAGSIAPLPVDEQQKQKLQRLGVELARRFDLAGLFNVDFVQTPGELWPVEINPRYSASMEVLERVTGRSFVGLHVAACRGDRLAASEFAAAGRFAGKAVVYAPQDCTVSPALDQLVGDWNRPGSPPGIADLPEIGAAISRGRPVATVLAEGHSAASVLEELRQRVAAVKRVLALTPQAPPAPHRES